MSTDYDIVCDHCRKVMHLGQRFTSGWAFGFGTNDREGQLAAGAFVMEHTEHGALRVMVADDTPDGYADTRDDSN